ncbi:hypothetical protein ACFE04_024111 [Oxalis oulophora]
MDVEGFRDRRRYEEQRFSKIVLSWSLDDILNQDLYIDKVHNIPKIFQSVGGYFGSYIYPLLEETRIQLVSSLDVISSAPFAQVVAIKDSNHVSVDYWRNISRRHAKEPYTTLPGDILVLSDAKIETLSDLQNAGRMTWDLVMVDKVSYFDQMLENDEDETSSTHFKFQALKLKGDLETNNSLFVTYLTNITTNKRIWTSLHMVRNLKIIEQVLSSIDHDSCRRCPAPIGYSWNEEFFITSSLSLNESQRNAVLTCLHKVHCDHKPSVELIWGPPGTGKTKTVSILLFTLLRMKHRILTCAATNIATTEVASRVLKLANESSRTDNLPCSLGDILLFGNKKRLKVASEIEEIYLDYRLRKLAICFGPMTGWSNCFSSMKSYLEDCVGQYQVFLENEQIKESRNEEEKGCDDEGKDGNKKVKLFLEYARDRCLATVEPLRNCIRIMCTHISKSFISEHTYEKLLCLTELLDSFENLLLTSVMDSEILESVFSNSVDGKISQSLKSTASLLLSIRNQCLTSLTVLWDSLHELKFPNGRSELSMTNFCFRTASLIFCTASSSYKLHSIEMEPLNLLVIDEAAQLKECESTIPLQLPGIQHAILIGDECQLPSMVASKVSSQACFGRSLFERLSSLGHPKHLLNVQYRMHPAISSFPNSSFYHGQIVDAQFVQSKSYEKKYLPGPMFGPYSFINIRDGREEFDADGRSRRNMAEVSVVLKILQKLYKAWVGSKQNLSVGVISPYVAQVIAIQEKLGKSYEDFGGFVVKVKSIDNFQGGEEDIIIMSTVRSYGEIEFISNCQRTNVALTRARHCLWILGNERTLVRGPSVWYDLIHDAIKRQCFFNADDDKDLAKAILEVKKEFDQMDDLLNKDSVLFRNAKWKVLFSDNFLKSFKQLVSVRTKKTILNLLLKVSSGWRPKKKSVDSVCGSSYQIIKKFKVEGLYIVCTVDIIKDYTYTQILKVWDVLPLEDIAKLEKRLEGIFGKYSDDYINRCKEKFLDGDLELPKTWPTTTEIVQFTDLSSIPVGEDTGGASDGRSYVENSQVNESLSLMKFYTLSSGIVSHLLSDRDGRELDLPFEVTDQEREIIVFPRSTFILGRSGTGKTTVLTMKLFKKEELYHSAMEGYGIESNSLLRGNHEEEGSSGISGMQELTLRQLFVTVSPKLCYAIKQHISDLKSGSYFERFYVKKHDNETHASRSLAFQSFIRTKEVTYERFSALYWPHFNAQITKMLNCSTVFTEIMSHIKGGIQSLDASNGKLTQEDYLRLSEARASGLSRRKREIIYDIYQVYDRMKMENGEYDVADLVIDLHGRLKIQGYKGDLMDFVYIDEVQDLTMSQIALFRYICKNVDEGFVFSGDTAQTIARGISFRFQDIRSLFYSKFVMEPGMQGHNVRKEKGQLSPIFNLSQNFRTHAGVLKLSQSIVQLLYRFFPNSIDVLKPETSLIYGEPPILLESGNNENAITTIFGNSGNDGGKIVGFGAEQVILVRDDIARTEISKYVGKQALILTILECKGLEFQDVLLYNFFAASAMKNKWRVVYAYMKEQALLDPSMQIKEQEFTEAKHNILCSELKQLYVAITRTRQRLWICENSEDISKPIFDYWKKKGLVQVRQLDDSLAQAMQVASTPEEWRSRGIKLFTEHNYEMAIMCFERAGDTYWERRSKAACLKANAERVRASNPEDANAILREAAEIYDAIGKADSAAQCFFDLGDYKRAGKIYMERCNELEKAGECFSRAGLYVQAANVYSKGNNYAECLAVCTEGKLFEIGLQYIEYWKQSATTDRCSYSRDKVDKVEHMFLESCARHYYHLKDNNSMMKFVRAFSSMKLIRDFLNSHGCFNELILLEEESGNFLEAANIAKKNNDTLREADLLGKAGHYKEACMLILNYVFSNSLWSHGSTGWPLKAFTKKPELLSKAMSLAKKESNSFHDIVLVEADILSNKESSLVALYQQWNLSKEHHNDKGEMLCALKIFDNHLRCSSSKYVWMEDMIFDLKNHSEEMISKNLVSVESLIYFWNYCRERIVEILGFLKNLGTEDVKELSGIEDFCFNFLGVIKRYKENGETIYLLLNSDADWLRGSDIKSLQKTGTVASIGVQQLVSAARSYWCSEVFSFGMKLLKNLEVLINNSLSVFCRNKTLYFQYEVAVYLLESNFLTLRVIDRKTLHNFIGSSTNRFFSSLFVLDWKLLLQENMISLRGTEISRRMLQDFISQSLTNELTYGLVGRMTFSILGSGKLDNELFDKVVKRFSDSPPRRTFIEALHGVVASDAHGQSREVYLARQFYGFLLDVYRANWRVNDYITMNCFLYLLERFLILVSCCQGYFFATKSSFVEWLIFQNGSTPLSSNFLADVKDSMTEMLNFITDVLWTLLYNKRDTIEWIRSSSSNVREHYCSAVIKLVSLVCLFRLNFGGNLIFEILGKNYITEQLPWEFYNVLKKGRKNVNVNVVADAFSKIGNPLVTVNLGRYVPKHVHPEAFFIDMTIPTRKEDVLILLFPKRNEKSGEINVDEEVINSYGDGRGKTISLPSDNSAFAGSMDSSMQIDDGWFWHLFEDMKSAARLSDEGKMVSNLQITKADVDARLNILCMASAACSEMDQSNVEGKTVSSQVNDTFDDLEQINAVLEGRKPMNSVVGACEKLLSRRPIIGPLLHEILSGCSQEDNAECSKQVGTNSKPEIALSEVQGTSASGSQQQDDMDLTTKKTNAEVSKVANDQSIIASSSSQGHDATSQESKNKGKNKSKSKKKKGGRKK